MIRSFPCCCFRGSSTNTGDLLRIYQSIYAPDVSASFSLFFRCLGHGYPSTRQVLSCPNVKQVSSSRMIPNMGLPQSRQMCSTLRLWPFVTRNKLLSQNLTTPLGIRSFSSKSNHYEVLGLKQDATPKDIRSAFLNQSKQCHPDLNKGDPNNHAKFVRVNEAYSVLSKPNSRRDYDLSLALGRPSSQRVNNSSANVHHTYQRYHEQNPWDDPQLYRNRHKSQGRFFDEENENPWYGVNRTDRQKAHSKVFMYCVAFMLLGALVQTFIMASAYGTISGNFRPRHGHAGHPGFPHDHSSLKPLPEDHHGRIR